MKNVIKKELNRFEEEYGIKIISARDTGSRAWNLESEESDYDVSFIYIQDHEEYIKPSGYKQNIDRETDTQYDIEYNSWNLDRFLALLKSSNPAAIEFLQSSKVYYEPPTHCNDFMHNLESHAQENFKPLALMKHHHNLAENQFERYIKEGKKHTYKRHLYCVRSLAYREYIKEKKELPQLDFPTFWKENKDVLDNWASEHSFVERMINNKKNGFGKKELKTRRIARKLGRDLSETIPDEEKPDYAQQNISKEFLNTCTDRLIKEINKEPCTWRKWIKSIWKEHTNN